MLKIGTYFSARDREVYQLMRGLFPPVRKPFAIAEDFSDTRIEHSDCCEIFGAAARPGEETSAGCGLAKERQIGA